MARVWTRKHGLETQAGLLKQISGFSDRALEQLNKAYPLHLTDPITYELYEDPVMTPSGNTYSRVSIMQALAKKAVDPLTGVPCTADKLIPNRAVADAVADYKKDLEEAKGSFTWWA